MKTVTCSCLTSMKCYILFVSLLILNEHLSCFAENITNEALRILSKSGKSNCQYHKTDSLGDAFFFFHSARCYGVKYKLTPIPVTRRVKGHPSFGVLSIFSSQRYIKVVKGGSVATKDISNVRYYT